MALLERAHEHLRAAARIEAATDDLRSLTASGSSLAVGEALEQTALTVRLLEEAHERYRGTALALREYALALRDLQDRADQAPQHVLEDLDAAARRAISAIDTTVTQSDHGGWHQRDLLGSALGVAGGLLLRGASTRRRSAHAEPPVLAEARRLRADSLDGRPYDERDDRHRELLARLLRTGSGISEPTRTALEAVTETLRRYPDAQLISFWLDGDEPRVAIGFGDLEHADSVTYVVHGINTDSAQTTSHSTAAYNLYADASRRSSRDEAFIAWLNYDSGDIWSEPAIALADRGAETLLADVGELRRRNPTATVSGVFHSYGSTTFGQSIIVDPTAFDEAYLIGSPGVSHAAARALETAIAGGRLEVHATQARSDSIATLGHSTSWEHPERPLDLPGVSVFSSEGADATTHRVVNARGILSAYDPGSGGVDAHDLDRPEGGGADFFGYLTRDSVAYRYVLDSLTEGG
ncbi:MAG TPA: alpha/beta hydrolase [Microbacteriaceae bacterium]|nr:alpha/beta hydrolase [Microbacteriaceae bacterium]